MLLQVRDTAGEPATHAFIVGTSHYPFLNGPEATDRGLQLGMVDLSSAARSASDVASWLLRSYHNPDAPLADISIFLSPSAGERLSPALVSAMGGATAPARRNEVELAFEEFRARCKAHPDNVAFVYVAGHGMQLELHSAIVLLEDFAVAGRDELYGAIDIAACRRSMDCDGQASHQVWFSDACRQRPDIIRQFDLLTGAYAPSKKVGSVTASPMFLAAAGREAAFARVGKTTIFSEALLWALKGGCLKGPTKSCADWHVPALELITGLPTKVNELLEDFAEQQTVQTTGTVQNVVLQRWKRSPKVAIEVELSPIGLAPTATAELRLAFDPPRKVAPGWPLVHRGPPGIYQLKVTTQTGKVAQTMFSAQPPRHQDRIEVT